MSAAPRPADRMAHVTGSATMAFGAKVKELRAAGEEVFDFTVGEPDLDTPAYVREAAKEGLDKGYTRYTTAWGLPMLREAIAETATRDHDLPATPDDVLVAPAKHALYCAVQAYLGPGDELLVPTPAWVSYAPMAHLAGARPVEVPCSAGDGFVLDVDALDEACTDATRALVLNTPSNPTGTVQPRETLEAVADLAEDRDLLVITDELYARLTYDAPHVAFASLPGMWERTVTVNGFSKAFAMTGWRLGWSVAPRALLEPMARVQSHALTCATAFAQYAGAKALTEQDQRDEWLATMTKTFRERRDVLVEGLRDAPNVDVHVPEGAFYCFPRIDTDLSSRDLAMHLLEESGVATVPGSAFGDAGEGYLRMAYTTGVEECRAGVERLAEALGEL